MPAWQPWLVWGLGALLFFYAFFHRVAPSVMIDHLMRDLAVGGAVLGNLSAFYFYAYASLQIPVGLMHDRWGPRRMLSLGALLCALGSFAFAWSDTIYQAYAGRLLIGAGAGFGFVGALKLATLWFPPQRFAQISGYTMMLGMAGGIAGQAPLAALVEVTGWRGLLVVAGLFGVLLASAIWLIVRDHPDPSAQAARPTDTASSLISDLVRVLTLRDNLLVALVASSMSAPLLSFAGLWGVAWLMQSYDMARAAAAGMASLLLLGWAIGAPVAGILSDRLGRRRPLLATGNAVGCLSLAVLFYVPNLPAVLLSVLFFIAGFCLAAMVVSFAVARECNPVELTGAAYGFVNGATVAAGAVFQPLIGLLLDLNWDGTMEAGARVYSAASYQIAFSMLLAFLLCGFMAALALPRRHGRAATKGET